MKKPTISVVIPVYNAEKYLEACFDSLIDQTFGDFEVIAINDGSQDKSLEIIQRYELADDRFKLVNQMNSGVCSARNTGIDRASGKYLYFLDSDDYIDKYTFERCIRAFSGDMIDMVFFDGQGVTEAGYLNKKEDDPDYALRMTQYYDRSSIDFPSSILSVYDWFKACFYNRKFRGNTALYMIKKEIIDSHVYKFDERISYYEDVLFLYNVSKSIGNIKYIPSRFYFRRLTGNSLMTIENNKKITEDLLFCNKHMEIISENDGVSRQKTKKMFSVFFKEVLLEFWDRCTHEEKASFVFEDMMGIEIKAIERSNKLKKQFELEYLQNIREIECLLKEQ